MKKASGVDLSEARESLRGTYRHDRRGRRRWFIDMGDLEITDTQREAFLRQLHATNGFNSFPFQETVETVGRAVSGTGRSFDETLLHFHALYAGAPAIED